jgi:hypothetical protein
MPHKHSSPPATHKSLVQDVCSLIFVTKTGLLETEYVLASGLFPATVIDLAPVTRLLDVTLAGKERIVLSHFLSGCQDAFLSKAGLITFGHSYLRKVPLSFNSTASSESHGLSSHKRL